MPMRPDPFLPWSVSLLVESVANPPAARCSGRVPHWVLGLTLAGTCEHGPPKGERLILRRGDVLLISPSAAQSWVVIGRETWRTIYAVFDPRPHWLPWLAWSETTSGHAVVSLGKSVIARKVGDALATALAFYQSEQNDSIDRAYHAIEEALLQCQERRSAQRPAAGNPRLDRARRLLAADLSGTLSLGEVARRSDLSRTQLALSFKAQIGLAPIAFRTRKRIERAMELLRLSYYPIKRVACEVGFTSPRAFSTCFRRLTGDTPRAFRRKCAKSS